MKISVIGTILFAILGLVLSDDASIVGKECLMQFKVKDEDFRDVLDIKLKPADVPENVKCALKCFMEKNGLMDAQGVLKRPAGIASAGNAGEMEKMLGPCQDLKGSSACDTAYQRTTCILKLAKNKQ